MKFFHFFDSVKHALRGFRYALRNEQNLRLQVLIAALVLALSAWLRVTRNELLLLMLLVILVLLLELLNSAVEKVMDIVKPRLHRQVKVVKDIMAAAVLLASVGAAIIGLIIFWPHFIELLAQ